MKVVFISTLSCSLRAVSFSSISTFTPAGRVKVDFICQIFWHLSPNLLLLFCKKKQKQPSSAQLWAQSVMCSLVFCNFLFNIGGSAPKPPFPAGQSYIKGGGLATQGAFILVHTTCTYRCKVCTKVPHVATKRS